MDLEKMSAEEVAEQVALKRLDEYSQEGFDLERFKKEIAETVEFLRNMTWEISPFSLVKESGYSYQKVAVQTSISNGHMAAFEVLVSDGKRHSFGKVEAKSFADKSGGMKTYVPLGTIGEWGKPGFRWVPCITSKSANDEIMISPSFPAVHIFKEWRNVRLGMLYQAAKTKIDRMNSEFLQINVEQAAKEFVKLALKEKSGRVTQRKAVEKLSNALKKNPESLEADPQDILGALRLGALEPQILKDLVTYLKVSRTDSHHWNVETIKEAIGLATAHGIMKE